MLEILHTNHMDAKTIPNLISDAFRRGPPNRLVLVPFRLRDTSASPTSSTKQMLMDDGVRSQTRTAMPHHRLSDCSVEHVSDSG